MISLYLMHFMHHDLGINNFSSTEYPLKYTKVVWTVIGKIVSKYTVYYKSA